MDIRNKVESAAYLNTLMAMGFLSIQNEPTREDRCIDHVMAKCEKIKIESKISQQKITDHAIVDINITREGRKKWVIQEKNGVDEKMFITNLRSMDWSWIENLNKTKNMNMDFNKLFSYIQGCREKATKKVKFRLNKKDCPRQP